MNNETPGTVIEQTMCYLMDRGISPKEIIDLLEETKGKLEKALQKDL